MRTISNKTNLLTPIDINLRHTRIEYTPIRELTPDDLVLVISNPNKNILDIITKMKSMSYKFITLENGDMDVHIYHKTLPEFEQCKLLVAAESDEQYNCDCSYGEMRQDDRRVEQ